ncbi:hypothetical protein [Nodosilinea sp. E11]|uniref:hypothetical protein n=1 Tax=Nodosilinea sp. E11 TaxID=3037479 RepID=UPI002934E495|nr:hypothetical protein [Nodosilinea sp. E11]WOD37972.1 hypothetical protein RRF56_17305 [Nodosilinea sp. E11]
MNNAHGHPMAKPLALRSKLGKTPVKLGKKLGKTSLDLKEKIKSRWATTFKQFP